MNKHTPGEWRIEDTRCELDFLIVPKSQKQVTRRKPWTGDYVTVCSVSRSFVRPKGNTGFAHLPLPEALANARLIAAAPELLEVLRVLVKRMRDSYADHRLDWTELDSDAYERAFKAIEKADGE